MTIRRTESTLGRDLRNLGMACMGVAAICSVAYVSSALDDAKSKFPPQDTKGSGAAVSTPPRINSTAIQDIYSLTDQDYATNH
jgi:hypothetical protein